MKNFLMMNTFNNNNPSPPPRRAFCFIFRLCPCYLHAAGYFPPAPQSFPRCSLLGWSQASLVARLCNPGGCPRGLRPCGGLLGDRMRIIVTSYPVTVEAW